MIIIILMVVIMMIYLLSFFNPFSDAVPQCTCNELGKMRKEVVVAHIKVIFRSSLWGWEILWKIPVGQSGVRAEIRTGLLWESSRDHYARATLCGIMMRNSYCQGRDEEFESPEACEQWHNTNSELIALQLMNRAEGEGVCVQCSLVYLFSYRLGWLRIIQLGPGRSLALYLCSHYLPTNSLYITLTRQPPKTNLFLMRSVSGSASMIVSTNTNTTSH